MEKKVSDDAPKKLNGKVCDLPDRISSVLNVLSNINVGGYNSLTNAVIET